MISLSLAIKHTYLLILDEFGQMNVVEITPAQARINSRYRLMKQLARMNEMDKCKNNSMNNRRMNERIYSGRALTWKKLAD